MKGTGYCNTKARFSSIKADHVIWVKVTQGKVYVYEMEASIYDNRDSNGFVDMEKQQKKWICELDFNIDNEG